MAAAVQTFSPSIPPSPAYDGEVLPLIPLPPLTGDHATHIRTVESKLKEADEKAKAAGYAPPRGSQDEYSVEAARLLNVEYWVEQFKLHNRAADGKVTWKLLVMLIHGRRNDPNRLVNRLANLFASYGLSHTALQIGSWIIHWTGSSLVIPQLIKTEKPNEYFEIDAMLDLTPAGRLDPRHHSLTMEEFYRNIATVIVRWNAEAVYNNWQKNCQHFVDELLTYGLRTKPAFGDAIKYYLKAVRIDHRCINPHYINEAGQVVFFKTHADLDQYYLANQATMSEAQKRLMKAFDRAFMLRWHRNDYKESDAENLPLRVLPAGVHTDFRLNKRACKIFGPLTQH